MGDDVAPEGDDALVHHDVVTHGEDGLGDFHSRNHRDEGETFSCDGHVNLVAWVSRWESVANGGRIFLFGRFFRQSLAVGDSLGIVAVGRAQPANGHASLGGGEAIEGPGIGLHVPRGSTHLLIGHFLRFYDGRSHQVGQMAADVLDVHVLAAVLVVRETELGSVLGGEHHAMVTHLAGDGIHDQAQHVAKSVDRHGLPRLGE